jgi:transmembrane sensor
VTETDEKRSEPNLMDEALDWIVRLKVSEPRQTDIEALRCWREQSPQHEEAFRDAVRLWRNLGIAAQELADEESRARALTDAAPPASRRFVLGRRAFLGGAIAASAAGYMIVDPPLGLWPSVSELFADYRTGKGEQRSIVLAEDVTVQMNTQTSIAVRSMRDGLEIKFISGEAAILKIGSPENLLRVSAARGEMIASRANFNVRCVDGVVAVTCIDGAVDIEQGQRSVHLQPDQQATYSSQGLGASASVDPKEVTAWQLGILVFHDRPLTEVVDEVNRYRSGKIIVMNAELGRRVVNGTFHVDRLGDLIGQIQQLFGAQVRSLPAGITLLS